MVPQAQATPPTPIPQPAAFPVARHLRIVAIVEIVWGSLAGLGALAAAFVGYTAAAPLAIVLAVLLGAAAVLALLGGTRLLHHRRSGRTLTYVCAAGSALSFPVGTAFAIYAFLILTKPETDHVLVDP